MKIFLAILLLSCSCLSSWADSASNSLSLSLPNSSAGYQSDKFRAGELDCSMAIGSATRLGKRTKSRIDCNRLYELELQKKELEVMKLQQEINKLRSLAFEN